MSDNDRTLSLFVTRAVRTAWESGLQGLVDRLATLNGRLTVHSPVGDGTRLWAEIPCG